MASFTFGELRKMLELFAVGFLLGVIVMCPIFGSEHKTFFGWLLHKKTGKEEKKKYLLEETS